MTHTVRRARRRPATLLFLVALIATLVAAAGVVPASAAKGGKAGATIAIDDWNPHVPFGEHATFTVDAPKADQPWVNARCYQGGEMVYGQWHGMFDGYRFGNVFTMGPTPSWSGGDAECVAEVGYFRKGNFHSLASTAFSVVDEG